MRTLNLGILAHVDAGKTSLTERLLFMAGVIDRLGSVDAGDTQTDSLELERQRGITIKAAVVSFRVGDATINLIDTPGHPDFIAEVARTLAVLDAAVVVVSAVEGVQAQTRVLVRTLRQLCIPFLFFVNKVDRRGAQYEGTVISIAEQLQLRSLAMSTVTEAGTQLAAVEPRDFAKEPSRQLLVDVLVENDEALLEDFVMAPDRLINHTIQAAMSTQVWNSLLYPVFAGSAATGTGVPQLVSAIEGLVPVHGPNEAGPVRGRVFKIDCGWANEKHAYVALTSGTIRLRQLLALPRGKERITSLSVFEGGKLRPTQSLEAGQIGRVGGLATVVVGDLVGESAASEHRTFFAPPTLETQVVALQASDRQRLWAALGQLAEQDPFINLRHNEGTDEMFVSLYGEVQKEVIASTLSDNFGIDAKLLESTVICAERLVGTGEDIEVVYEGDNPFNATIGLRVEPRPEGAGNNFSLAVNCGLMPAGFYRAVEETVENMLKQGVVGWPVIDCQVTMFAAGQASPVSTAADFRRLTPLVLASALKMAGTVVCQPFCRFRIYAPRETMGTLLAILSQAGAEVTGSDVEARLLRLEGTLAMSEVQRVQKQLPDFTSGTAAIESALDHYAPTAGAQRERGRKGANPFNRLEYLVNLRRASSSPVGQ
jgi:ribosomal protection tetracycline resistance protein